MRLFIQNVQRQFSKMQKINTLEQSTFKGSTEKEEPMKSAGKEMPKSQEETETKNEGNTITNHKRDQGSWVLRLGFTSSVPLTVFLPHSPLSPSLHSLLRNSEINKRF